MAVYRSAQGKLVDMNALVAKNQKTRAVGNMSVNARGDSIDSYGRVIQPVTEKVTNTYSKTVGNRSANAVKNKPQPANIAKEDLTDYERQLSDELGDDEEIEQIKAKDKK